MSTVHAPFTLRCGDDWAFVGPMTDASGAPLNLSGATLTWKLDDLVNATTLITLTLGSGITVTDAASATVAYGPSAAQTAALIPGTYKDYLQVTLANGAHYTLVEGQIVAAPKPA